MNSKIGEKLFLAARTGDDDEIECLLTRTGIDVNTKFLDKHGRIALCCACEHYNLGTAGLFLCKYKADVNGCSDGGDVLKPLSRSVWNGGINIVKLLLAHHADTNVKNCLGNTPLHIACIMGRADIVEILLHHEIDTSNERNEEGGYLEVVRLMIENGLDMNIRDNDGETPLHSILGRPRSVSQH
jgi:uncharacterized protein